MARTLTNANHEERVWAGEAFKKLLPFCVPLILGYALLLTQSGCLHSRKAQPVVHGDALSQIQSLRNGDTLAAIQRKIPAGRIEPAGPKISGMFRNEFGWGSDVTIYILSFKEGRISICMRNNVLFGFDAKHYTREHFSRIAAEWTIDVLRSDEPKH